MKKQWAALVAFSAVLAVSAGCSKSEEPKAESHTGASTPKPSDTVATETAKSDTAPDLKKANELFVSRCVTCHGPEGKGNGPGALTLNPKPRNYHDKEWQARVTDEDIKKTILYGGAAVGKSPIMPASPDLDSKPQLLDGLVSIVRNFGKS
jgi:mono/diheme cytochrome c family protein